MFPDVIYRQMFEYNEAVQLLLDPETRCLVDVNPAAARFYGYPREEMRGMPVRTLYPISDETFDYFSKWIAAVDHTILPTRHRLASGELREVEIHISRVGDGQKTLLAGIVKDVTPQVEAEKAHRDANTWLNAILKNIPGGAVVLFDHDLRYLLADGAGLREVGLNKALMEGKTIDEVFPPGVVAQIEEDYRLALQGQESIAEVAYAGRVYLVRYSPVYDETHRLIAGMAVTTDITERKKIENVLRESEMQYRSLIASLAEGVVVHDKAGKVVFCNASAEKILGMNFDQMRGLAPLDSRWRTIYADGTDFPFALHPAMIALHTGQSQRDVIVGVNKPDDTLTWISVNSEPVQHEDETLPYAVVTSFMNITRLIEIEKEIRTSERKFQTFFDLNPDAIVIRSLVDGRIMDCNKGVEYFFGFTREELIGLSMDELPVWVNPQLREDGLRVLMETGEIRGIEAEFRRKDGSTFWGLINALVVEINGEPCIMNLTRDITQFHLLEQQKREMELHQEKMYLLRQFLGNVSHDLKTPLTTIKSSLYVLKKSPDEEKKQHQMKVLELQTERMEHLLDEMFSLLRLDAGAEFDFEIADINALIRSVLAKHHALALAKHHQVAFVTESEIQPLRMDKSYLEMALGNLLINAHHYTPEAGHVTVRTFTQSHQVIIEIEDTGIGITPSDLPHIFERFYRADWARSTASGGTGLGLTIAQKIVEAHGGQIRVESMVGEGTRFQIVLPLLSAS